MAEAATSTFQLQYRQGDLFTCPPKDALAHCISQDLAMAAGIAVAFKSRFGGVAELRAQGKGVGDVAVLKRSGRFVYYLITKVQSYEQPTYRSLHLSLLAMKAHCLHNKVQRLSIPRIGCGIDSLTWDRVSLMINEIFADTSLTITVYTL